MPMGPLLLLCALASYAAEPVLPSLVEALPPVYPADLLARGESAAVLLELEVTADGRVAEARIVESAGPAFDASAVQAARSFRFTPGTDAVGRPVGVTIRYRVVFEPSAAPVVSVEGRVREAGVRRPVEGLELRLEDADGRAVFARTDADGRFRVAGLPDGPWTVTAAGRRWRLDPVTVEVVAGEVAVLTLFPVEDRPWATDEGVSETIEVVGRRPAPEVTRRALDQEEIRFLPGTNGDVVRVVQNLPGVARPPLNIGQLIIRGTAPEDSAYYLDGVRIPNVFHFAGLSTVLNADLVSRISLLPGGYGVRYGRTLGGAVDVETTSALPERSRGYASVDLFQATAFVEQRIGERSAVSVSGRRSWIDGVLNPILAGTSSANIRVPRYYDLQARVLHQTRSDGVLDVLFLLSDDAFRVVGRDADDEEQVQIGFGTSFQKLRVTSREALGDWRHELSIIGGPERQTFALAPDGEAFEEALSVSVRDEIVREAPLTGTGLGLRAGIDAAVGRHRYRYAVGSFGPPEEGDALAVAPAAYVEPSARLGALLVVGGGRVDGQTVGESAMVSFDPRLAARLELGRTTVKASGGGYSQLPTVRQLLDVPTLGPQRSWQAQAGVERAVGAGWTTELTGFVSLLQGLVSGRQDAFRFFSGPPPGGPLDTGPYANDGAGRVVGVEGLVRYGDERTAAWLSVTASRSTRVDRPDGERSLFLYDQPLVVTALASRELPRRWRLGARVRYGSGNPYTPVVNRYYDLGSRTFRPVYAREGARLPPFYSVDVRVDRDIVFRSWTLTTYLDLQNATNAQNIEVMGWNFDYTAEDPVRSIPVVPAFGLRGEW